MSGKARVFVAIYSHGIVTDIESTTTGSSGSRNRAARAGKYHWGIWVEPKGSEGHGTSFDIDDSVSDSPAANLFGGRLHILEHKTTPHGMLGRLMIGKIPEDGSTKDIGEILSEIPLPGDPNSPIPDGVSWIKAAIQELQDASCAESFYVEHFVKDAYSRAKKWEAALAKGSNTKGPAKINYTRSRTFP